jgi:hypothetical protein
VTSARASEAAVSQRYGRKISSERDIVITVCTFICGEYDSVTRMPCPEYERLAREREIADQNALNYVRRFGGENYEASTWIAKSAELRNILDAHQQSCKACKKSLV